jgi:hypothetical protein
MFWSPSEPAEKASEIREIALFPTGEVAADYIRFASRFKTLMQRQRHLRIVWHAALPVFASILFTALISVGYAIIRM